MKQLVSISGGLIPSQGEATDDGFSFFLSNTANQNTLGNLGTETTFVEGTMTELSIGVAAGTDDVQAQWGDTVSYTHLRAHETREDLVCRLLLEKKN